MANSLLHVGSSSLLFPLLALLALVNSHTVAVSLSPAGVTWYGSPTGGGSTGGACGYGDAVEKAPYSSMISAGNPSLFKSGMGCGACYQVQCSTNDACSGNPVTVVIADECPGGACVSDPIHFDMSGAAMGGMAKSGQADELRGAGVIRAQYARAACDHGGAKIAFKVDAGSNSNYLAVAVMYVGGDGDLSGVEMRQGSPGSEWTAMQHSWGALWKLDAGSALQAPFSFRLTSGRSKSVLDIDDVIPNGWQPGNLYTSFVNY